MTEAPRDHEDLAPRPVQQNGVLVLNKPSGPTSNRCITAIKRMGQKKIGHAGTLDPMAGGVLLVLLGQGTKLSGYLLGGGAKIYRGTLELGRETDTWDREGTVLAENGWDGISADAVRRDIASWTGSHMQPVPPYSAAKHNGRPLYSLARSGQDVPEKTKRVEISQAEVLSMELPAVSFRVKCSSGTYIRSLAHSLGMRLGCGAVLTELTREYSHPFGLDRAVDLDFLQKNPELPPQYVHPIREVLAGWPQVRLGAEEAARVRNGIACACPAGLLDGIRANGGLALLLQGDTELAVASLQENPSGPVLAITRGLWN